MKLDINVSKTITINTGNYSSVKPSVSITIKDVELKNTEKSYKNISEIVSNLLFIETAEMCENSQTIQDVGIDNLLKTFDKNDIENENKNLIDNLLKIKNNE